MDKTQQFNEAVRAWHSVEPTIISVGKDGGELFYPVTKRRAALKIFRNTISTGLFEHVALVVNSRVMAVWDERKPAAPQPAPEAVPDTLNIGDYVRIKRGSEYGWNDFREYVAAHGSIGVVSPSRDHDTPLSMVRVRFIYPPEQWEYDWFWTAESLERVDIAALSSEPEATFKVGDKVRLRKDTSQDSELTEYRDAGTVAEITEMFHSGDIVIDFTGDEWWVTASELEKTNEPKVAETALLRSLWDGNSADEPEAAFKVGDKVRIRKGNRDAYGLFGDYAETGAIATITDDFPHSEFDYEISFDGNKWMVLVDEIEPVTEQPEPETPAMDARALRDALPAEMRDEAVDAALEEYAAWHEGRMPPEAEFEYGLKYAISEGHITDRELKLYNQRNELAKQLSDVLTGANEVRAMVELKRVTADRTALIDALADLYAMASEAPREWDTGMFRTEIHARVADVLSKVAPDALPDASEPTMIDLMTNPTAPSESLED